MGSWIAENFGLFLVTMTLFFAALTAASAWAALRPLTTEHGLVHHISWPTGVRPTTYGVDRKGVIRRAILGARTYENFEEAIRGHLETGADRIVISGGPLPAR